MRLLFAACFVFSAASSVALATASEPSAAAPVAPRSASILLRLHPSAWQMPAAVATSAGITFLPDTGEPLELPELPTQALTMTSQDRALARVPVLEHADGSRHAVLGGALRAYSVVHIAADGRLVQDCVHTTEEAEAIVGAKSPRKGGR